MLSSNFVEIATSGNFAALASLVQQTFTLSENGLLYSLVA